MRLTKKPVAILISVLMIFAMIQTLPMAAVESYGAEVLTYLDENGTTQTVSKYYSVDDLSDAEGISMYDGSAPGYESYYVVSGDKTFENRLNAFGKVHLILKDGAKLTLRKGLNVPEGSSLLIYAQSTGNSKGKIFAATSNVYSDHAGINLKYAAAIGGNDGRPNGTIIINGGDITAHGYNYGAGIGSGDEAGTSGYVIINGGTVNAYGGYDGAGIGGGNETNGGHIVINGGDVHAESGYYGAAIGGGDDGDGGEIVINGGKVYARNKGHDDGITTSKVAGAAIGGGRHGNAGKIEITGGEVTAWGRQRGAAIGSGGDNNSSSHAYSGRCKGGEIHISGGTVTADPNYNRGSTMRLFEDGGAGIGSGAESFGVEIWITGGHTTAYGSFYDAEDPDLLHPTGIKPSAVIGNGYDTESPGYIKIEGNENSKTYVHASNASKRTNSFGSEPDGEDCTVEFDYPRAIVEKDAYGAVLNAEDRWSSILNDRNYEYKIYLCDHGRTFYDTDRSGHWKLCRQCGAENEKQEHSFTYLQEEIGHSQWCEECGYVTVPVAHKFDPETGECVCGHKGIKLTIRPENATSSGGDIVNWLESGDKFTLPEPEEIGFEPPELSEFKYWKVNGNWREFSPGEELTMQADTEIYPVYETSWNQFKALVEDAEDGATIVLPGNCTAPADATHIVIASGKSLTLDLNGYELARGNCNVTVTDGLGDGDVITVQGNLTVIDSSSDQTGRIRGGGNILFEGDSVAEDFIGGGGVTVAGGSFLLESGILSGNIANHGGAVGICGGGTFTMTGGKIEDNMTWNAGSAVYVENGVFQAQGGEITDNQVLAVGGAVELASNGSIEVLGSLKIIGNRGADRDAGVFIPGNVYLTEGQTITVAGALDSSAEIGVGGVSTLGTQVTTGLSGNGSVSSFVSDNADVAFEEIDGEIKMAAIDNDYRIDAEIRGNGSVVYGARRADEGNIVSLRAIPDEGYRFDRWEVVGQGASLSDPDSADTLLTVGIEDVTVKVYFVLDEVPVTGVSLNVVNGGQETPLADGSSIELYVGEEITLSASVAPANATDKSVAWSDDNDGNTVSVDQEGHVTALKPGASMVTVRTVNGETASVRINVATRYTVTFDVNGGEGMDGEVFVAPESTVARPEDPTKEDYRFVGWRQVKDDGELEDEDYDFSSAVKNSFTLKAVWAHAKHDETSLEHYEFIAPTCTEDGQAEYWHCNECNKNYIFVEDPDDPDKTIAEEVTDDYIVIQAGHTYGDWESLDEENHQRVCAADPSHTETQAHVWNRGEVTTQPTDTEAGDMTYICEICGMQRIEAVTMESITEYEVNTYIEGVYDCGEVLTEPASGIKGTKIQFTAFPQTGFVFGGWKIKGATCEDPSALSVIVTIEESDVEATATFIYPMNEEELVLENTSVVYNGEVQKPVVETIGGRPLKENTDYTLTIKDAEGNVVTAPKDAGTYTVTAEGTGTTCTGTTASVEYTIDKAPLASADLAHTSLVYTGKARTQNVTVKADVAGATKTLTKDTDYTVSYSNNKNVGTATMTITGIGNYTGTIEKTFKITPKKITPAVTLAVTSCTWNGKVRKPGVTVKDGSTKLASSQYTVTYASGRKNVGKYNVKVTLKGNYSGSKTVSFKINPKGTALGTLTAASKAATVKWTKQASKMSAGRITGYQIQLATDSKFTKNKKLVTVKGYSKVSKKVTGLSGGKKYYVRIRTYKTVSGVNYFSSWSKAKTVTTKK